ncbi:Lsr2 family protein [Streptomyces albus]|uniref:Lsr2 family DNA-binding protein n=1 Tax=Streptomyces albus TaxID=1888 RepID=UPI0024ADF215|nr:histone-like nucleoid-structuring protein Lsr2 [Streptomyces albus]MDI6413179.1 Lsr2 family protein [Streptomyces albus]
MFTDWQQALEAEGLPLHPTTTGQEAAAARTLAHHATSKEDLLLLLDMVGLPGDDDTLTTLLPLLNSPEGDDMQQTPAATPNAFEATALSMYYTDHSMAEITQATGLSEAEITVLVDAQERKIAPAAAEDTAPAAADAPPAVGGSVEQLLTWAEAHPTASVRNKAARVRTDLAELTARRAAADAQREAEHRVAKLTAELEKAKKKLRAVKAGAHSAPAPATAAAAPTRAGLGSGRTREELAAIRTWARANGHQVADAGMIRKSVLQAYDDAHHGPAAKAS